jgi:hypothetical protein
MKKEKSKVQVLLGLESQAALIFFEKKLTTRRLIYYGCPIIEA